MNKKKLTPDEVEMVMRCMDEIRVLRDRFEESGKEKRIVKKLDDVCGTLYNLAWT